MRLVPSYNAGMAESGKDSAGAPCPVELLKRLINCRSVTPEHGGALDAAEEMLSETGFATERMPSHGVDNLWASPLNEEPRLIFAGHVDVVPPGDLDAWSQDPFRAEERDGFIYGRGATDMKSGVAAMLCAAAKLRREGARGVAVLLTSDEEGEAIHGTRHVTARLQERGVRAKYCIVGEPTCADEFGDTVKTGRRGSLTARLSVAGRQTHAAYPHMGDNPIPRLVKALSVALDRFPPAPPSETPGAFPPTAAQAVFLSAGAGADNVIPGRAQATINFRYAPPDTADSLRQAAEAIFREAAGENWECEWIHGAEPFQTLADGALAKALSSAIQEVCGRTPAFSTGGGTSDGRFLRVMCDEVAEFGVRNETMHAPDERVAASEVRMLEQVYARAARSLLSA